ncbi:MULTISPECIES: GlxA family transcriptional regulator [Antarcticibacterium]|uniref:GlxA family transcriptional regulator n=1 Tax=Antarcticibacterium TaxID=2058174 RepID=UPI001C55489A|nr:MULTISPECIES: helix-turn-helix domain-containing protein [Antarcticibacterium]
MKHISILIPYGHTSLVNIEGSHQVFNQVNQFLKQQGKEPAFKIELVGLSRETKQSTGLFTVNPGKLTGQVDKTDLIIIPAIHGDQKKAYEENKDFVPWITGQYAAGAEIASLCVGAFFLASTGLLDGKQCATHWIHAGDFRKQFPNVQLVDDKILTDDGGIYTSGGAYSYLNLLLYLIEKYAGREMAILISKTFMIDIDKSSQSPFIIFSGQREHEDRPVRKVQEYIEQNFNKKIEVRSLAPKFALSRRSLERRFKKATANTVTEYIQRVKIEAAKKELESGFKNINEVMYLVGYNDNKAFRNTFKKFTV